MWRCRPQTLLGVFWGLGAFLIVRRQLRAGVLHPSLPAPPAWISDEAYLGVGGILARLRATCLEEALVKQCWKASRGDRRDVIIGLPHDGFGGDRPAHAWIEGLDESSPDAYTELHRLAPHD